MKQQNWQHIIFNCCIALNCLLVFIFLFQNQLQLPLFLQALGRAHPLILHFPIVLLLLAFVFETIITSPKQKALVNTADWILLSAALSSVLAALMGLFLSKEEGYESDQLNLHKWMGTGCSILSILWYAFKNLVRRTKVLTLITGTITVVVLFITGHNGANITHGDDFLLAPILNQPGEMPTVYLEDALIYPHLVRPILEAKCMGCHNSNKARGELIMTTPQLLLKGGKNGKLWNADASDLGLMMQRIHLPLTDEAHMPPNGKPQLSEEELRILYLWVKDGASFTKKVIALDSMKLMAASFLKSNSMDTYEFTAADDQLIKQLNTDYRNVAPVATGSPGLAVNFYGVKQFQSEQIKALEKIKDNIVSLHLSKMPVTDEDLKIIGGFTNLRNLNLSFTTIKGNGLQHLTSLQHLKQLSLSGTAIKSTHIKPLMQLKKLVSVEVWNTSITSGELAIYRTSFPKTHFEHGFSGDTVVARLSAPVIDIDDQKKIFKQSLPIVLKTPINGAIIRYTLDGSEPDSVHAAIYTNPVIVNESGTIKAKAYLKGWISSNVSTAGYYKNGIHIDSIQLITQPAKPYLEKSQKGKILTDGLLGTANFNSGDWIGYRESPFEAYLFLRNPTPIQSVTFNTLIDLGSYIFPPAELQVWGGDQVHSLRLLSKTHPIQPGAATAGYIAGHNSKFPTQTVRVIKLIVQPVKRLPEWHPGKGDRAWVFLDELFIN